jgi:uncharacterized RmlC-like cupin family protein
MEPGARVIRSGATYEGLQGIPFVAGLTAASAGTRAICMTVATIPPGARTKAHRHEKIETAVYVIEGEVEMYWGRQLEHHEVGRSGDYVYVAADTPHVVLNRSATRCVAVVAHSAADDQQGIVLLPELDARV